MLIITIGLMAARAEFVSARAQPHFPAALTDGRMCDSDASVRAGEQQYH